MSTIMNILLLVVLGGIAIYMIKRMRSNYKKPEHVAIQDPAAQKLYNKQHPKKDEEKSLSIKEKIELSWQFVTHITEQVISRFSSNDQSKVYQAGKTLLKNGMKYQHNVSQEAKIVSDIVKARAVNQSKDQSVSR